MKRFKLRLQKSYLWLKKMLVELLASENNLLILFTFKVVSSIPLPFIEHYGPNMVPDA